MVAVKGVKSTKREMSKEKKPIPVGSRDRASRRSCSFQGLDLCFELRHARLQALVLVLELCDLPLEPDAFVVFPLSTQARVERVEPPPARRLVDERVGRDGALLELGLVHFENVLRDLFARRARLDAVRADLNGRVLVEGWWTVRGRSRTSIVPSGAVFGRIVSVRSCFSPLPLFRRDWRRALRGG